MYPIIQGTRDTYRIKMEVELILLPDHLIEVSENNRHYIRLQVPGLHITIRIVSINGGRVKSSPLNVLVLNIGPGGLRFITGLQIPANRSVRLSILTILSGIRFETEGYIVWRRTVENVYEYGVEFDMSTLHRSFLIRLLNYLFVKLYPEHQKIHQYYAHITRCYLEEQRSTINYTV